MSNPLLFAALVLVSIVAFVASCVKRFSLLTIGKPEDRLDHLIDRVGNMLVYAFGQKRVAVSRYPFGLNHFFIFWSFLVLLVANAEFVIAGITGGHISLAQLPTPLHAALSYLFDIISLVTLITIVLAMARRLFFPPKYIEARSRDAFVILGMIAVLMIAFFSSHACEITLAWLRNTPLTGLMPVSTLIANRLLGQAPATLEQWATISWWIHAVVLLAFLNYLPYSKHMHILTAIPNCFLRRLGKANVLPREQFTPDTASFGVGQLDEFTWKDLFDSFSCTECGRCQHACPANFTGKPLNPRQVIHDIKANLLANGARVKAGQAPITPLIGDGGEGSISADAIWSCTSCGACLDVCPVFIEQMPKILQLRRHLVEMKAEFPEELLNLFENMEQRSNPWGIAPSERTKWCADIDVQPFTPDTEYLLFVGCAGAFDSRNKQVSLAVARLLNAAGVSWGILGKDEKCCGDSLRRLGNEYVFDRMARENVKLFHERGVKKIITPCPHCFSTLNNDYTKYGLNVEVLHHSELIAQLVKDGKLTPKVTGILGNVVFHDSCYLGRHNDVYEAPRDVIAAATGSAPAEMPRHHANSFCCGAGGGRMWMEESLGTRINLERVREALHEKPDTICVSCPYCLTMFEDGMKDVHADEHIQVKDIAEVLATGLENTAP